MPEHLPVELLHVDDDLVAVAKPAGLPTDTTPDPRRDTLCAAVRRALPAVAGPWVAHRLDVDTSGVVVFARTARANAALSRIFAGREATKVYLAIVAPALAAGTRVEVVNHLRRPKSGPVQVVRSGGDRAETALEVLDASALAALIQASPRTGRMHQIRVHLAGLGHPIVGDRLYGSRASASRTMLHAWRLRLPAWEEHGAIELCCPPPPDFVAGLAQWGLRLPGPDAAA